MVSKSLLTVVICYGFFVYIETKLPKALAKRNADSKEYSVGEQRSRRRQNYIERLALENELFDNAEEVGPPYDVTTENDGTKEDLPALIVDYANMIRNDIILLDNSVETRTRKRGNVKLEKHNQAIPDVPCSCEYNKEIVDLGESCYPRMLENRTCNDQMCTPPYKCQPTVYELTILKRRTNSMEQSAVDIPSDLRRHKWIAQKQSVTIGCMCTRDYIIDN